MPATYVDQVQKLDIRSMMAAAFKADPSESLYRLLGRLGLASPGSEPSRAAK